MAENNKIVALYRIAEKQNKYTKEKPEYVNNQSCLNNFYNNKGDTELVIFGDRLEESKKQAKKLADKYIEVSNHGNAQSFREAYEYALNNYNDDTIIYFVEDDYIHKPGFIEALNEAFSLNIEFVSLYDHPDKYNSVPKTLIHTKNIHWQFVISTTMTFAARVKTLRKCKNIFWGLTSGNHPYDHDIFSNLNKMGKYLITPIPGFATHATLGYMAPTIEWKDYL